MNQTIILPDGTMIQKFRILGTSVHKYEAWEPRTNENTRKGFFYRHSNITHVDDIWYGRIGTSFPPSCGKDKSDNERIEFYDSHRRVDCAKALNLIFTTFPHLMDIPVSISSGTVETSGEA